LVAAGLWEQMGPGRRERKAGTHQRQTPDAHPNHLEHRVSKKVAGQALRVQRLTSRNVICSP